MKWCPKCRQLKDIQTFSRNKSRKDGLNGWCKLCSYINRKRYKNNPNLEWNRNLKRRYGIDKKIYEKLLKSQKGRCKICLNKETRARRLSVDHDHKTGRVRGLLCNKCNLGLGKFKDNINLLKKAVKYLNRGVRK